MSIGHRLEDDELADVALDELYRTLGDHDTAKLYADPYVVDVGHDCPFGAGNSLDRKTVYIDRTLYQEAMDNAFAATGLEPQQIIERWLDHEHAEKCIVDGDNPVDLYYGGHRYALRKEHEGVLTILGTNNARLKIITYEKVIWPALQRCYNRPVRNPPMDLWCGPLLDDPDQRGEEILRELRKLGVVDAKKRSKYETNYGVSGRPCNSCRNWHPEILAQEQASLADCAIVSGLARNNRHCDFYVKR